MLAFSKYHGTGNDFILIDHREGQAASLLSQTTNGLNSVIAKMCNRRFGVGADGVIFLCAPPAQNVAASRPTADFEMKNYNADGSVSSFCGNGARTLIQFASDLGIQKSHYYFLASDGEHEAKLETTPTGNLIHLKMQSVTEVKQTAHGPFLNTGSPHLVCQHKNIADLDVCIEGGNLRHHADFAPHGTNVNFIEKPNVPIAATPAEASVAPVKIRTFERGIEGETLSCGTGVIAAALVLEARKPGYYEVEFSTKGGKLKVCFEQLGPSHFENIWLIGPAVKVFSGQF